MWQAIRIDDPADERLAPYTRLRDPALRSAVEAPGPAGHGLFIAEGKIVLPRLLGSRYPLLSVLVTPQRLTELEPLLAAHGATTFVAGQDVIDRLTGYHLHRGVVAAAQRLAPEPPAAALEQAACAVIVENLTDQENLGAIARSAAALGVEALLLDPRCCDPLYRRVVRVSMGWVLHIRHARLEPWPDALATVADLGFRIVALTPSPDATPIDSLAPARPGERTALLLGAEGTGLSAGALGRADVRVRIPQHETVDSLNVGHAAAIAFHRLAWPARCGAAGA